MSLHDWSALLAGCVVGVGIYVVSLTFVRWLRRR